MLKTILIIPCYNEELTIANVIKDFRRVLPKMDIYVIDNNSTDKTRAIAKKNKVKVLSAPLAGKSNAVRKALDEIDADIYIMVDGDDTYPAIYAPEMINYIVTGGYDLVVGDRLSNASYKNNTKRNLGNFGNNIFNYFINFLFNSDIHDIFSGYRVFTKKLAKALPVDSQFFELEIEMTIFALDKRYSIKEVPIEFRERPEGSESKLNSIRDGFKILKMMIFTWRDVRPLAFYGLSAFIVLLVSFFFSVPVFCEYFKTGLVPRFPTLIVSIGFMIVSMILFNIGLILQTVSSFDRKRVLQLKRNI